MSTLIRRNFSSSLKSLGLNNRFSTHPWIPGLAFSPLGSEKQGDILVCIFQRGAVDGLNMVVPFGEDNYYNSRPTISIPQPASGNASTAIALDSFFGLHPALKDLKPVWDAGSLAAVHACGSPDPTHSHFDAQNFMERGTPGEKQIATGWISRHLATTAWQNSSPFRAVSLGTMLPTSLQGEIPAIALRSIPDFRLGGKNGGSQVILNLESSLKQLYHGEGLLEQRALLTFDAMQALEKIKPGAYTPTKGVTYGNNDFGQGLKQIAQLIKADIGLEIATLDIGGWDTHILEGGVDGQLAKLLTEFGSNLAAFYQDLQSQFNRVTVITMSEFGRRVQENGNGGTDHGHGNVMFILSSHLASAKVFGNWPGLSKDKLYGPGDLAVTTDYRQVLAEVLQSRLNNPKITEIFPDFTNEAPLNLFT